MSFADILNNVPLTWITVAMFGIYVIYRLGMVYLKKQKDKKKLYHNHDDLAQFIDRKINGRLINIETQSAETQKDVANLDKKVNKLLKGQTKWSNSKTLPN